MFTGIIETTGFIKDIAESGTNRTFTITSRISDELKVDQSVSHNGVCLTVEDVNAGSHTLTAIEETLRKTTLGNWKVGDIVNIERCLKIDGRLDGHFVQGHVDCTAVCVDLTENNGSWEYRFRFPASFAHLIVEKGSIAIEGISLTLFDVRPDTFKVAIIPYTYNHTNLRMVQPGTNVNIEFDMVGKHISRMLELRGL